jgi:hypothetical protein
MIVSSDRHDNANNSIRVNREFDSNVIDESDLQDKKHFDPTISIFFPISIADDSERLQINL